MTIPARLLRSAQLLCLLTIVASSSVSAQLTFEYGGVEREYYLDLPLNLADGAPLVLAMHGYTSSAATLRFYSGWSIIAGGDGAAVCYPQGTLDLGGTSHWNANLGISATDDHGFLLALTQHLQAEYGFSPDCTFACGMSNGGYMSYSLACHHPEIFRAVGSVTGAMSAYDYANCTPSVAVPVIHLHGTADDVVSYENGVGDAVWGYAGVPEVIELWTDLMGTTAVMEESLPNQEVLDLTSVDFVRHYGALGGQEFHHYRVNGGGHDWFGVWGSQDIQSTELLWEFFQSSCSGAFTGIESATVDSAPQIGYLNGDHVDFGQACHVRAYDSLGRQLWARQVLSGDRITPADLYGALVLQLIGKNDQVQALRIR
jgi:polyhydroxybutyrate depolymerase